VYDGGKVKRFKSRDGAKAYAAKNGGKVASSEHYADNIQKQGVTEDVGTGKYSRVLQALDLYYPRLSMEELNVPGFHKVIADKANVPVQYAAQVIDDFVKANEPDDDEEWSDDEQDLSEAQQCPECGGAAYDNEILAEKQDACYSKVKSRYKVWPSAYASGALVRCRKVGAKNWGNKSKKK
jgi:hypothetical protein